MSTAQTPKVSVSNQQIGLALLVAYLMVYSVMLLAMRRTAAFDVTEPLMVLAILGVGFTLAAWLLTIGIHPLDYPIRKPKSELAAVAIYLLPVVAFVTWGLDLLHRYVPTDPGNAFVILVAKILVFIVVPAAIMRAQFGYGLCQLAPVSQRTRHIVVTVGMSVLLLAFQALLGHGLRDIASAHLPASVLWYGVPLTFVWLAVEAGVVEEFFFRVLLQTRLSAVLQSELGAIVLMSAVFGLAHAPGLYLRTGLTQEGLSPHPSLLMAVGYSIVITSVAGFFLGVLWARTRNFAVVVVVHAVGDLLPNVIPTLRSLRLLG
ncbi:MAG TPA: CPBP family intramembrane glutamic endopeptidase [Terriglobales bacterium]|nr:CPBP family intramembrane glutamic endopeptidase [Terriglobales bacterium]